MAKSYPVLCCSIAGSIGGLGVKMHNAAFRHLGLEYTYVSFEPDDLKGAVDAMRNLGMRGMAVTMPFKTDIISYLDELDEMSREIGAINTVVNTNGVLKGYNTDVYGAVTTLREAVSDLAGKKVCILGGGGVSKTIIWGLKQFTDDITIYEIDEETGRATAQKFGVLYGGDTSKVSRETQYDILINCTPVGFKTQETILTADRIRENTVVLDVVFLPLVTEFQKQAKLAGCRVLSGTRMIMHQACKQFELYTGQKAPFEVYESTMNQILREQNS